MRRGSNDAGRVQSSPVEGRRWTRRPNASSSAIGTATDADADADSDADTDTGPTTDDPCAPLPPAASGTVDVSPGPGLKLAVEAAAPGATLLLADGTYSARETIVLDQAITIRSASG